MIATVLYTGLRISEMLGLVWDDGWGAHPREPRWATAFGSARSGCSA
jgi:integrase